MTDEKNPTVTDRPLDELVGRETSYEERATWGVCPVCSAGHGEWCHAEIGAQLGVRVDGRRMQTGEGAHVARLQKAPMRVRLVPC